MHVFFNVKQLHSLAGQYEAVLLFEEHKICDVFMYIKLYV